ncbi:MAG TPA: undecaprenyl-diphosphatase UppP [Gemmatimonadaceae bacterium]|nr:undecaprenyl-diphosphatase UppP [Gemmatimonadaceae bacterium]
MTLFQAIVLGTLQGLTEFLPVSSSAHLSLAPWLFGWPEPGLSFDVALHVGTLVAVLWFFWSEWLALLRAAWDIVRTRRVASVEQRRVVFLVVATIPAVLAGLLLEEYAETVFRAPIITAIALILMGVLLWAADRALPQRRPLEDLRWRDAVLIGLAQVFALVPGVSRSGSTITMGRVLQLDRQSAAVFSFLMSMPVIAGAAVLEVPDAIRANGITMPLVAGVVASGVSGWLAIAGLLRFVSRNDYTVFAVYRVLLGAFVIWLLASRGWTG